MRNASGLGRLGGLAVGLGIGAALAATPGVASADPVSPLDPNVAAASVDGVTGTLGTAAVDCGADGGAAVGHDFGAAGADRGAAGRAVGVDDLGATAADRGVGGDAAGRHVEEIAAAEREADARRAGGHAVGGHGALPLPQGRGAHRGGC